MCENYIVTIFQADYGYSLVKLITHTGLILAARYTTNRYRNTSSVSSMLDHLQMDSLESRRSKIQLTLLYKIVNDMIDIPADEYLTKGASRTRSAYSKKYRQYRTSTDSLKYSFFPRTIPLWNSLPASIAEAPSLVSFKKGLTPLSFLNVKGPFA